VTLYGDQALQPDSQVEKDYADYQKVGMSPDMALARAQWEAWWSRQADLADKPERDARDARVGSLETGFAMAVRRGEAHTLQEKFAEIYDLSLKEDELGRRAESHRRRQGEILPPGQLSGSSTPVPAPVESPASKRSKLAAATKRILGAGPKPASVKETPEQYAARYCRSENEPRHVSYR
jgi:hypothetical protein